MADKDIKLLTAELMELCEKLYPDEWRGKYTSTQLVFRNWLNTKTGLTVDHRNFDQREAALRAWVSALKELETL